MTHQRPPTPKRSRLRLWLRRSVTAVLLTVVLLATVLLVVAWWFTRPKRLARLIESSLNDSLAAKIGIDKADLFLDGRLIVSNLTLGVTGESDTFGRVLCAKQCTLHFDRSHLLHGHLLIRSIALEGVDIRVVEDVAGHRVNLTALGIKNNDTTSREMPLPKVTLADGHVHFDRLDAGATATTTLGTWDFSGELNPTGPRACQSRLQITRPDQTPMLVAADLDFEGKTAIINVTNACLREELSMLTPPAVRVWWRKLNLSGELPAIAADLDWIGQVHLHRAEVKLQNLTINPHWRELLAATAHTPLGEVLIENLGQENGTLSFTDVSGLVLIDGDQLRVPDLTSTAHGEKLHLSAVKAHLSGRVDLSGATGWSMGLSTEAFDLADSIPILSAMPDTRDAYARFQPAGRFSVNATASANSLGESPILEARIQLLDAKACYERIPYPIEHLTGTLVATMNSIHIEQLAGQCTQGGKIRVQGHIEPLTDDCEANIHVNIKDMPWGTALKDALPPATRLAVSSFLREDLSEKMQTDGILSDFVPGGMLNADVDVVRHLGAASDWETRVKLDPRGLRLLHEGFPYPLTILEGALEASDYAITASNIKAIAPNGASIQLDVAATDTNHDGDFGWQLSLKQAELPTDALLRGALPPNTAQLLADMDVSATLHVAGTVAQSESAAPGTGLRIRLTGSTRQAELEPFHQGYRFHDVAAQFSVTESTFSMPSLTGLHTQAEHPPARFTADSEVAWTDKDTYTSLHVTADPLVFGPDLAGLAPPGSDARKSIQKNMRDWRPSGHGRGELLWSQTPTTDVVNLAIRPAETTFTPPAAPHAVHLTDMDGTLTFTPEHIVLEDLFAKFEGGQAHVNGVVGDTSDLNVEGLVAVNDGELPDTLQILLPVDITQAVRTAKFDGTLILSETRIHRDRDGSASGCTKIEAQQLSAKIGNVPITHANGRAHVDFAQATAGRDSTCTAVLEMDALSLLDRPLQNLRAQLSIASDGEVKMKSISAVMANGRVTGDLLVQDGRFAMNLELMDANWNDLLHPENDNSLAQDGLLNAHLRLRGDDRGLDGLEGDGRVELAFSNYQNTDRRMRLVEALNGIAPGSGAIESANLSTDFSLADGLVNVENLVLDASSGLRIAGAGTASLRSGVIDMQLVTRNRQPGFFGPLLRSLEPVTNEILGLRVSGTLDDPKVQADSFAALRGSLRDLLPGVQDTERPLR